MSPLKDKVCVENQTVKFEVELNKPDLLGRLVWLKNGEEINLNDKEKFELKENDNKYTLIIKKAQFEDEASYTVKVKDTEVSSSANLSVTEAPLEFIRPLTDVQLKENQNAKFECELNKSGEKVTWYRNGEPIEPDSKDIIAVSDGKVHSLLLKKVDPSQAAKYTVKTAGPSSNALLYIEEIPVEFNQRLTDISVKEKETATFTCELNKENAPVKWYKFGIEITPDENKYKMIVNGNKYSLQILDCHLDDISDYSISLRGRKCAARLNVEGEY